MKRLTAALISLFFTISMYAEGVRAYIQVTYSPIPRTVTIIVGDSVIIPKDSKGQPRQFNTVVAVLNWLSKKGWHVEPIDMNKSTQSAQTFLMSRDDTTDKDFSSL